MTLLTETEKLLKECPREISLADIAKATNLKASWLSEFIRGNISDPGVKKVQILHDYLSGVKQSELPTNP